MTVLAPKSSGTQDRHDIALQARRFRDAILRCPRSALSITLHDFPHGACSDASFLLTRHLHELGHGWFDYVLGGRNGKSHAWLEGNGLIVDITADQFPDNRRPIIVVRRSQWHRSFLRMEQHVADFRIYDDDAVAELLRSYNEVKSYLRG